MLVRSEDGGERADLALSEAVVEGERGQPFAEPFQYGDGHDRRAVVRLAQPAEFAGGEAGVPGDADPDGRRGEDAVGPSRLDEVEDPVGVGCVEDGVLRPDREVGQQEDMQLRGVVERQRVDGPVGGPQIERRDGADVLVHERAVGHHRALGQCGGARGVEQLDEVSRARLAFRGEGARAGGGRQEGVRCVAQRAYGERGRNPVGEVRVGEDEGAAGLFEDVGEVVAGEVLVDRHVDQAGAGTAEEADQIRVGVVRVAGDPVARVQSVFPGEDGGGGTDGLVELPVGPCPVRVPQGGAPRGAPGAACQDSVDCAAPYTCHGVILCGRNPRVKGPDAGGGVGGGRAAAVRG